MTDHTHDDCPTPTGGVRCNAGVLYGPCGYELCDVPDCADVGHCECACHSGRTCGCGRHTWPANDTFTETK